MAGFEPVNRKSKNLVLAVVQEAGRLSWFSVYTGILRSSVLTLVKNWNCFQVRDKQKKSNDFLHSYLILDYSKLRCT